MTLERVPDFHDIPEADIRVVVGMPIGKGGVTPETVKSLFDMAVSFAGERWSSPDGNPLTKEILFARVSTANVCDARTRLVGEAASAKATHILFIDSDMTFPADALSRMLRHHLPIVALNYPRREIPCKPTAYQDTTGNVVLDAGDAERLSPEIRLPDEDRIGPLLTLEDSGGLVEVSHAGAGFMLVNMGVFEMMDLPWFVFEPLEPEKFRQTGEDVYFCRKARAFGIPVFVDQSLSRHCGHVGDLTYVHRFVGVSDGVFGALFDEARRDHAEAVKGRRGGKGNRFQPREAAE